MKKIFSLLMVVAMIACFMPSMAFAGETSTNVAQIGTTGYPTLQEAFDAAQSSDRIELLENVTLTNTITVDNGKDFTLDLNGKTISKESMPFKLIHGKLNIVGSGTIQETANNQYSPIVVKGSINNSDKEYSVLSVGENVTLKGWAGIFVDQNNKHAYGVIVNISGTVESPGDAEHTTAGHAIYINGNIQDKENCPVINITSTAKIHGLTCKAKADGTQEKSHDIYAAGYAKWIINGNEFTNNTNEFKGGDITINGGSFTTTEQYTSHTANTNGTSTAGYALAVVSNTAYAGANVVINGGTFSGPVELIDDDNIDTNNNSTLVIKGGKFSKDPTKYVASGYAVSQSNGTYTVYYPSSYIPPATTPTTPPATTTETKPDGTTTTTTTTKDTTTGVGSTTEVVKDKTGTTTAKAEVTAPAATTVANGTATSTVTAAAADKLIEQTKAAEKTAADSGAATVKSTITITADTSSAAATKAEVSIPAATVNKISSETKADVVVKTAVGEITLDAATLKTVSDKAATGTVKITAEEVKTADLPTAVKEQIPEGAKVLNLSITTENGNVSNFNGGTATIMAEVPAGITAPKVVYIMANGQVQAVPCTVETVGGKTYVKATTGHFSYYAIMSEEEANAAIKASNDKITAGLKATKIGVSSQAGKGYAKLTWTKSAGYKVDGYKVYRSKAKTGTYKLVKITTNKSYKNTNVKKGSKYYYKVRGYRVVDGKTVYTQYSKVTYKTVK